MAKLLHNNRLLLLLFGLIALALLLVLASVAYSAANNHLLMPLDDVYIHFQYAKQMALGQPYVYNPGQPATSGATSFLYPYLLAAGYFIGFKGLWLGLWAMLLGTIALIAAQWAVYRLCLAFDCPQWLSVLTAIVFALTGSVAWHFMSGMETGLMIALTLWTLLMVVEKRFRGFIVVSTLLTLMRPEGGILALIACATMVLRLWRDFGAHEKRPSKQSLLLLLLIPIAAIGVQPLVNLIMTGSTVATGNQAKSILASVPHDWSVIIGRIVDNFLRMWWEFVTGYDGREGRGWYLPLFTGLLGLCGIVILLFKRNWRLIGFMLLGWLLASTAAISTLDTAFWHFKRYQMPMLVLFFPLAAFTVNWVLMRPHPKPLPTRREGLFRALSYGYLVVLLPLFAIAILLQFINYHRLNVGYVYQQPYQMALWLRENTPEDAVIAVHDVGLMRYMGERTTLDMVGLTTPGAAAYWRNGPGSVAEFLINEQPDYIASYGRGHGYGLAYLADTSLYGEPLASFPIENWNRQANVALAADFQGIYQPNLERLGIGGTFSNLGDIIPFAVDILSYVDVANLDSENLADYEWHNNGNISGFPSQVYELNTLGDETTCDSGRGYNCSFSFVEAGRVINQSERFNIATSVDAQEKIASPLPYHFVLATLVQVVQSEQIDVYVNDTFVATRTIPDTPGRWYVILTDIPPNLVDDPLWIEIIPHNEGTYAPYFHVLYDYYGWSDEGSKGLADYEGAFYLESINPLEDVELRDAYTYVRHYITFDITWFTKTQSEGDYRFFIHLYNDVNQPPVLQRDIYFRGMPTGNWLQGALHDTIYLNVARMLGTYQVAIGFYNPQTGERLHPTSDVYEVSPDGRLWLGEITIGDAETDTQN